MVDQPPSEQSKPIPSLSKWRRARRWSIRGFSSLLAASALYFVAVLVLGWIPVNSDYEQAETGVEIRVWSNGLHTDFVLPARTPALDFAKFAPYSNKTPPKPSLEHVVIGWGDHDFYIETPTDEDFSLATTLKAIFLPTSTVVHVKYYSYVPEPSARCVRLRLREDEYRELIHHILESFELDDQGKPLMIEGASYGPRDVFYRAKGTYHLFNTCNNWANRGLKRAGIKTALWAPFDYAIFDQVKNR